MIQHVHKDYKNNHTKILYHFTCICSMPALSLLFFFENERVVFMVLVFYYKGMLEKVKMQRTFLSKEPS